MPTNRVQPDPDVLLCDTCSHNADCEITDKQKGETCGVYVQILGVDTTGLGRTEVVERVIGGAGDVDLCSRCARFGTDEP